MPALFFNSTTNEYYSFLAGLRTFLSSLKRVTSQFDKTDTTLANITGLTFDVETGESYEFEAILFMDADVTGGSKYAIAGTATATAIIYQITEINNAGGSLSITARQTALGGNSGQAGNIAGICKINGVITVNAAGTLTVQFAQNATNATSSILVGSTFGIQRVP